MKNNKLMEPNAMQIKIQRSCLSNTAAAISMFVWYGTGEKKTYFTVSNQALRDDRSVNSFTFSLDTCNCSRQMDLLHLFCEYYFFFRWNLAFCFEWSFVCVCFFQFDCLFHLPFFCKLFSPHTHIARHLINPKTNLRQNLSKEKYQR